MQTRFHLRYAPQDEFYHSTVMLSITNQLPQADNRSGAGLMDTMKWYERQLRVPGIDQTFMQKLSSMCIEPAGGDIEELTADLLIRTGVHRLSRQSRPAFVHSMIESNPFLEISDGPGILIKRSSIEDIARVTVKGNSIHLLIPHDAIVDDAPVLAALTLNAITTDEEQEIDLGTTRLVESSFSFDSGPRLMVIGAGGLGCPALTSIVSASSSKIVVVDHDTVSVTDLHRQTLYRPGDIGKKKADVAKTRLEESYPDAQVESFASLFNESLIDAFRPDILLFAVDSMATRRAINAICLDRGLSFVDAAVNNMYGYGLVHVAGTACYECVLGKSGTHSESKKGILALTSYYGGLLMARLTSALFNKDPYVRNRVFAFNLADFSFDTFEVERYENCGACGRLQ